MNVVNGGRSASAAFAYQLAWSLDGHWIATGSEDHTIHIWDAKRGAVVRTLTGHASRVRCLAWSPDGHTLASGSDDRTVRLWDLRIAATSRTLGVHDDAVRCLAWSPDGHTLASGSDDRTVRLWDTAGTTVPAVLTGHQQWVRGIAWSPDGRHVASASADHTVRIWDIAGTEAPRVLAGHGNWVLCVAWSPDGRKLATGSRDRTVRLWDALTGREQRRLEGHTGRVTVVGFSDDGRFLFSQSDGPDGMFAIVRTDTWTWVTRLSLGQLGDRPLLGIHPRTLEMAVLALDTVRMWQLDSESLLDSSASSSSVQYSNAKVVLVGDTGVGKSGLALVLSGRLFTPTESTHNRHVWTLDRQTVQLGRHRQEQRETYIWDLAGQPGYRIIHQLHLDEVAVAVVVIDGQSETNPFSGVHYWARALKQAEHMQGGAVPSMKKFLVAARIDRGGIGVSQERIRALVDELGFDGYFETSAKTGQGIKALADAIRRAIMWEELAKVNSPELFQRIQQFLVSEKQSGRVLESEDDCSAPQILDREAKQV